GGLDLRHRVLRPPGGLLGEHYSEAVFATASPMAFARSTTRGPQREAMSSSSSMTRSFLTAVRFFQPGRWARVSLFCRQHFTSARKIRSGSAWAMNSADSLG